MARKTNNLPANPVFVSYVRENAELVKALATDLARHGVMVWLDREKIRPGERWRVSIQQAIEAGSFFIACFSDEYSSRDRTYMNEELTLAIEALRRRPGKRAWFIPVLFSPDSLPEREVGAGKTLHDFQAVDLSPGPKSAEWADQVRRLAYLIKRNDRSIHGADFPAQVQAAIARQDEAELESLIRATARVAIETALQAFIRDPNTRQYGFILRPLCKLLGNQFTAEDVIMMVTRGGPGNSRTGFHGLDELYDSHLDHMRTLRLPQVFAERGKIRYYCKLRERYPSLGLGDILEKDPHKLVIEDRFVDRETFYDKFPNRGSSAFLDSVFVTDEAWEAEFGPIKRKKGRQKRKGQSGEGKASRG